MSEIAKSTWPEVDGLLGQGPERRARAVALLPIGSTEPHGPHLPLDADVTIAVAQTRRAAECLRAAGVSVLVLPPLAYGVTHFTEGFAGTVGLRPGTLWALVEDVVSSLERQGVRRLVLSNGHLEPEHVEVLRGLAADWPGPVGERSHVLLPDNTRRRWAATLGPDFAAGDHAGRYETSIVLAADPGSVRALEGIPPVEIGLVERIRAGARSFLEAGADQAYCGDPAAADAEEGRSLIERLAEMIVQTVREAWPELFA